ncbi:glutaminase A [Marinicauda sp. Alg238-R41]|uniref:glutaminase A n=1 Tax=Marinicauda sp. Alg238-R41 TaxID=2993447 RepID=UPI0022E24C32|nr:glutaminase A [Marinicauda sp. Alg238-R41]
MTQSPPDKVPARPISAFTTRPAQFERAEAGEEARQTAQDAFAAMSRTGPVTPRRLAERLESQGLERDDPRLKGTWAALGRAPDTPFDASTFCDCLPRDECHLVGRAVAGALVTGEFGPFRQRVYDLFHYASQETGGQVAAYIPELAKADPDAFALGGCTIDGQRLSIGLNEGDETREFCVQSVMKPINYAIALELLGEEVVHTYVGREPSGQSFNEITLDRLRRPHNPMINAGAIMTSALIRPTHDMNSRFDFVQRVWRSASGGEAPGFDRATFDSESHHADRNYALAYFMREHGGFPEEADLFTTMELYLRCCSIQTDVRRLAAVAATLANGGVNPVTERQVFQRETVKDVLSLMLSCGMYDFSGEYAFTVGLPAKSGVSGTMMIVVPGVVGLALYSPRLGAQGNPERGVEFSRQLVRSFPWHVYAPIVSDPNIGQ